MKDFVSVKDPMMYSIGRGDWVIHSINISDASQYQHCAWYEGCNREQMGTGFLSLIKLNSLKTRE